MKIEKVAIKTKSGTEITIPWEEARELYEELHKAFGPKDHYTYHPYPFRPHWWEYTGGITYTSVGAPLVAPEGRWINPRPETTGDVEVIYS